MKSVAGKDVVLAGLAGAAMPLAFAPFNWWWLAPVAYAVLFLVWRRGTPRAALVTGFSFGAMQFLFGIYWIVISVHEIGQAPIWLAVLLMLGLVAVMACYPALAGWVLARYFSARGRWYWLGTVPALLVFTEWLRGWAFTGFGWLAPGYAQTESWLIGYAPLAGLHGVSWSVFLLAGCLLAMARGARGDRLLALAVAALIVAVGFVSSKLEWTEAGEDEISIALTQGATPQEEKWLPENLPRIMAAYQALTIEALGSDLIVWPEAAVPYYFGYLPDFYDGIEGLADAAGSKVMVGSLREVTGAASSQNAVFTLGQPEVYVKRHLVPYGEYFPVPSFIRDWLRSMELPNIDTRPGAAGQPPIPLLGEQIAVTICYEDVFGAEQLHSFPAATLIVNVSNDAWFGKSIAAHQHLQIARMRAAEVRRWQLRSTNTGITAVIDPFGQVSSRLPQFTPGVLRDSVTGRAGSTPYIVTGNWLVVLLAVLVLVAARMRSRQRATETG